MNNTIDAITVDYEGHKTLKWAKACIDEAFKKFIVNRKRTFTVSAAPNSGKTRMAGTFAKIGIDKYFFDTVIVCTPTKQIRSQWPEDVVILDLNLTSEFNNSKMIRNRIDRECDGVVITYQQLLSSQEWFRKLCNDSKALVILDEVHHLANEAKWGESVKHAFEYAEFVMSLSGTPFRHDGNQIPFQEYEDEN